MNRFGDIEVSFKKLPPVYGFRSEKLVSLDEALRPILPHINELSYYIKIAKRSCHYPSEHGLSRDQSAAIYIYTMEWGDTTLYRVLNQALRAEDRQVLKIWFPYLKLFDTALELLPTVQGPLWRGVPLDIGNNFKRDQIITWWSVNSCSSSVKVIEHFLCEREKSTLFLIEAIKGKRVSGYTEYEKEEEIILRIGTRFCVKSDPLYQKKGSNIVHLKEIGEDDDDSEEEQKVGEIKLKPSTAPVNLKSKEMLYPDSKATNSSSKQEATGIKVKASSEPVLTYVLVIPNLPVDARWEHHGVTVAGGHDQGGGSNQLNEPVALCTDYDDEQTVIICDYSNHRITQWKKGDTEGKVVAGGKEGGCRLDQLWYPTDVLIERESNSLIIADSRNGRVVRWSRCNNTTEGEILIDNIKCWGLAMDMQGNIYVSDNENHQVKRYDISHGDKKGTIVAGGNGRGSGLNQLDCPFYIFVDRNRSLYVSDCHNHRVVRWDKGEKEGTIVAGGQRAGKALTQLWYPNGILVDSLGTLYVAESKNDRVTRWPRGAKQGSVIVGGNGKGKGVNQFNCSNGLSVDKFGNLYVVDHRNHRVQRFTLKYTHLVTSP